MYILHNMHNYILHSYSMICYVMFYAYTCMCKEFTDYSTRILLWKWGKLLSSYQMPSCVRHISPHPKTSGWRQRSAHQWLSKRSMTLAMVSFMEISMALREDKFCEWKQAEWIHMFVYMFYLGTSHLAVFHSGSALVHFTGGCRTRQQFLSDSSNRRWCKQDFQLKKTQKLRFFQHAPPVLGVEIAHLRAVGVQLLESATPHGCRTWGNPDLHQNLGRTSTVFLLTHIHDWWFWNWLM